MVKTNTFPICFGVLRAMRHYHICHTMRGRVECGVTHRQIATLTHDADYRLRDPLDAVPDQVSTHVRLCIAGRHCAARSAVRPRARTTPTGVPRLDQDLTNCLRPPVVPVTASRHPGCRSDSHRPPTPHERTLHAGTGPAHMPPRDAGLVPETGFSAYVSRARATSAIRPRPVHMAWDRES
jgi:hypothetical protein